MTEEKNREPSTSKTEPMDWSPTRSESSLPSPVRSRSRSGSPSPPRTVTINLFPLSDSIEFTPKHLSFNPEQQIKVGRVSGSRNQKEAKQDNGVFSCDVMSREHALLKEENGKILIRDLKSTHGTFINHVRLGDGSDESDWRVLNHGDIITFGHSVRRNQNLYKHLSAYIFYPKETKDDIHSPNIFNGTTSNAMPISNPSTISTIRVERSENVSSSPSVVAQESTSARGTGISQNSVLQRSEGPASYYIAKSGGLPSATSSVTNNKFGGLNNLSVIKPRITDIVQASEAPIIEPKQISTTSSTSEEMSTSIQKLKIGQSDEKSHKKVENKEQITRSAQENNGVVSVENNEKVENSNNAENGHKSMVSPEITSDLGPVEVTGETTVIRTSTVSATRTTVSFVAPAPVKERVPAQVTRETKQSKVSRREKEVNVDKNENEHATISNGEGPSHVTEDDTSTDTSITLRKRKYEEVDEEENGTEEVNELKEKLAELKERANDASKRRKWDIVYSTVIGMAAGAVGIGACAYMFGN